ncbi:GTPase-activating protein gyp8 [Podospora pseudopauciseta]|uniref:GTPase-activating protein gyp8 n=1 Tax=Podospora pseudopauciseta TaxID=2093780 RepID=A0ABR0HFR3_9PEZI|nr:GTPase-activating protein gyp8 [Podospora pseudopauciseta]
MDMMLGPEPETNTADFDEKPIKMEDPIDEKPPDPKDEAAEQKKKEILKACKTRDFAALRTLAASPGGFLTDTIRQQAWPLLLGIPSLSDTKPEEEEEEEKEDWKSLPPHKDESQVQLDVNRAFVYYPNDQNDTQLSHSKTLLSTLIIRTLRHHPYLSYFQGYHDICQVLLLTLPPALQPAALAHLSLLRIRDFMLPNLHPAIAQLRLLPDILRSSDPELWQHLSSTEPFFALSGTLTMYAHDITNLGEITRLFDVLLARDPVFSLYLFAAIVRSRRGKLLDIPEDEPEMLHSVLSKLPQPLDLEGLISQAVELEREYPPEGLRGWGRGISRWSVLKTGRGEGVYRQGLEEGREAFEKQIRELEWRERVSRVGEVVRRNRGVVRGVGFAVLVAVVGVVVRRFVHHQPGYGGHGERGGMLEYVMGLVGRGWVR